MPPETNNPPHPPPVAIIVSRYNRSVTDRLLAGAVDSYRRRFDANPAVLEAAGAYELVSIALAAAESGAFAGLVALGCIIRGQTPHDLHLARAVTRGLTDITLRTGLPVGLGVLTVENVEQARARSGEAGRGGPDARPNKGAEAMEATLGAIAVIRDLRSALHHGPGGPVLTRPVRGLDAPLPDKTADAPVGSLRQIRRAAFQALYQFDARGIDDAEAVRASLDGIESLTDVQRDTAAALAREAFEHRRAADEAMLALAPTWPAYRQAAVDRAILRLAHYEMTSGRTPPKVAVNEAVELAKEYSTEKSPAFINGLLDKVLKQVIRQKDQEGAPPSA